MVIDIGTRSFLQFHRQGQEPLRDDEISILNGVLSLNNTNVAAIMTPMQVRFQRLWLEYSLIEWLPSFDQDVVTISYDKILDHDTLDYM